MSTFELEPLDDYSDEVDRGYFCGFWVGWHGCKRELVSKLSKSGMENAKIAELLDYDAEFVKILISEDEEVDDE